MPERLLELWLGILVVAGKRDDKAFKSAQGTFVREYRRANYQEQGQFHWLLAEDNKRWADARS